MLFRNIILVFVKLQDFFFIVFSLARFYRLVFILAR